MNDDSHMFVFFLACPFKLCFALNCLCSLQEAPFTLDRDQPGPNDPATSVQTSLNKNDVTICYIVFQKHVQSSLTELELF